MSQIHVRARNRQSALNKAKKDSRIGKDETITYMRWVRGQGTERGMRTYQIYFRRKLRRRKRK